MVYPTRDFNADDVIFTFGRIFNRDHPWHNVNGSSFPYFDSLQFADSVESVRKLDNQTVEFRLKRPGTPRSSGIWPPTMRQLPLPNMPPA
ncbi:Hemin-binding lipoprotein [Serratia liquefaciens]|nr:Hemin-binding lipoprotein [Serratia liquefaciens]